jgi:N-acetylglucosaminyldiphosphoundecaprenol N-acetyl-beta-D-mannosaminyltransferase
MPTDLALPRARFIDIDFDSGTYEQVVRELDRLSQQNSFSFVVTPNVDHVLMLHPKAQTSAAQAFQQAYAAAAMLLCDSRILQRLARRHGVRLDVVTGSDLTAYLFQKGHLDGRTVAIVGGDAAMVPELHERFPAVRIVQHQPPMGVLQNPRAVDEIIAFIEQERAHYVLMAIGAPQSEIVAHKCLLAGKSAGVGLCIGASIEFLLDRKRRAPHWMQRLSLEWAFRLFSEPGRLWRRYLVAGPRIFVLATRWGKVRSSTTMI